MKCTLIILCALMGATFSEAKWCIKNITTQIEVAKILSRTKITPGSWLSPSKLKVETYQVVELVPKIKEKRLCCDGYVLEEFAHKCFPICANGCPKMAECVEPDTCKCNPGYHLEEGLCRLDCGNCENGHCTDLGSCECNPRYVRIDGECAPICRHKCVNGFCAAPDQCQCNPGYQENSETGRCEPVCTQNCGVNAYCSAPEVCSCKYGFFGDSTDVCQPWCKTECKNGQCIGPNNCACHQGFAKVDGICIPDCQSGCQFGDCLDEGICQCWPTFVYNNATGSCQESLNTENTTQIVTTQTTSLDPSTAPFCSNNCGNGTCLAGICHCQKGFTKVEFSCIPFCQGCLLGDCVEETVCQPLMQMKVSEATVIAPTFPSTSEISTSELPTTVESSSIEFSSESTEITSSTKPSTNCENGCWAGTCADGVCQCPDGLILNDENDCIMPCEATCKNGICTQDNVCECRSGYTHKNGTECVPQCDKECINSFCIAPNHCECLEGYIAHLNPSSAHVCLPTCDGIDGEEGCLNGTCVAVNKCQCLEGFVHKPGNRFECIPFVDNVVKRRGHSWYLYLLLGLLILLVVSILGLFALRKMHQDTYNVDKVEKRRGTVRYKNDVQPYCEI